MIEKKDIIECCLKLFEKDGVKFSILDIATELNCSKRTIYQHFSGKAELISKAIDYVFEDIERQHHLVVAEEIKSVDKLKKILLTFPTVVSLEGVKLDKILQLHPEIYKQIIAHFESKWELTLNVFEECKQQGQIKPISATAFKTIFLGIYEASMGEEHPERIQKECLNAVMDGLES